MYQSDLVRLIPPLQGTCQQLEKSYFRLTRAPDPSTVRPEPILRKALDRLVGMLRSGNTKYLYAQDQFKVWCRERMPQVCNHGVTLHQHTFWRKTQLETMLATPVHTVALLLPVMANMVLSSVLQGMVFIKRPVSRPISMTVAWVEEQDTL